MKLLIVRFALLTALTLPGGAIFARNQQRQSGQASQQQPPSNSAPGPNESSPRKPLPPDDTNPPAPNESSSRKHTSDQPAEPEPAPEPKSKKKSDNYDPFPAVKDVEVGEFYMRKGDLDAAIARFEEAIQLRPNYAQPRLLLAQIYEKKGEKDQAVKYYKEYLQVYPRAPDARKIEKRIEKLSNE